MLGITFVTFNILVVFTTVSALKVEISPSQDLTAVKWKQVYMRCKVTETNGRSPTIEFAKDGKVFTKPPPFPLDWKFGKILLIRPLFVKRSDGYYECIVRDGTEVVRKGIYVTVKDEKALPAGFPRVKDTLTAVYPYYGDNFTLPCDHTGNPKPVVSWFHARKPLNMSDPRRKLLPNGSLQVIKVTREDRGHYECELRNMFGVRYSDRDVVYPRPTPPTRIAPKITKGLKDMTLTSEDSVWLSCSGTGVPSPIFTWEKNGERIYSRSDGSLYVEKIIKTANFTCICTNMVGKARSTAQIVVRGKPLTPTRPEFVKNTPSSITISWKPSRREIYPITYFVIQHKRKGDDTWREDVVPTSDREFTLKKLTPYVFVTFRVLSANSLGRSRPSEDIEYFSGETVPKSPAFNIMGKGMSDTSIFVEWLPPLLPNGRIEGYRVYYTTDPTFVQSDWDMKHAGWNYTTVTNLDKNGVYYFKVQVYGVNGDGPMSNETTIIRALKGAPSPPRSLKGRALTSKSVELFWTGPTYHGNGLDGYEIHYTAPGVKSEIKMVDYGPVKTTVKGLKPFSNYSFKLAAKSYAGIGPFTKKIIIQTHEDVPTAPPMNVRARPRSSRSIEVFWKPPPTKDQNGIITGYKIMYTPIRSATPKILKAAANSRSALLMGLRKFTRYTIWMLAVNKAGEGPSTHKFELFTEEDVPDTAPTDIRAQH